MRKEISGILLFFLVVFSLISLLSFSPLDPSVNHVRPTGPIQNIFGLVGAHMAGFLIFIFGLGSFWVPILLLLLSIHFFAGHPGKAAWLIVAGGFLLAVSTGSLFTFRQDHYLILGSKFSSGGVVGILLKNFLTRYLNVSGGIFVLALSWVVGFILTTGFSLVRFARRAWQVIRMLADQVVTLWVKWNERRKKAQKRAKMKKEQTAEVEREITIKVPAPKPKKEAPAPKQEVFEFMRVSSGFQLPPVNLLDNPEKRADTADSDNLRMQSRLLEKKLDDFGVNGKVVTVTPGPVITTFEYEPAPGVKINKIVNLSDDLSLALRAASIRIVAPIPGKAAIGIEIPNSARETVCFKEVVVSSAFEKSKSKIPLCLGKDIIGNPVVAELDKMPHLLIAGATGSGKSVALNAMICSFLYRSTPEQVRLIMVDPKRIELSSYDGIPHLITPVVTNAKKATNALFWAVKEMENRYELLSRKNARHINQYNQKIEKEIQSGAPEGETPGRLPFIVIVIDELADLMMVASRDVEVALTRLAQMARAAGIHLILATQRPSVDVLTGIIKANFPTRLTFQVSSKTDSRTIIDANGAESLLGSGDMLFLPPGTAKLQRIHGAFISEAEITRITEFLKKQQSPEYDASVTEARVEEQATTDKEDYDEKYDEAVALVTKTRQASISMIQRHLRIGYNRAARIIEVMEKEGIVGPSDGVKPREVLAKGYDEIQ